MYYLFIYLFIYLSIYYIYSSYYLFIHHWNIKSKHSIACRQEYASLKQQTGIMNSEHLTKDFKAMPGGDRELEHGEGVTCDMQLLIPGRIPFPMMLWKELWLMPDEQKWWSMGQTWTCDLYIHYDMMYHHHNTTLHFRTGVFLQPRSHSTMVDKYLTVNLASLAELWILDMRPCCLHKRAALHT